MKRLMILLVGILVLLIGAVPSGAITLEVGDFGMKFRDISYYDIHTAGVPYKPDGTANPGYNPASAKFAPGYMVDPDGAGGLPTLPGQEAPPGWVGTGNLCGIASVTSIRGLMAGDIESPVLGTSYWVEGAGGQYLQAVYGGLTLNRTVDAASSPGSPATAFPHDSYFQATTEGAYLKLYLLNHDAYALDVAAGPGTCAFSTFGTNIKLGQLWLDMVIAPGLLYAYDPVASAADLEHVKNTSSIAGAGTMYANIVGGTAQDLFVKGQFPLYPSNAAWYADPYHADIKFISNLTALVDLTQGFGNKYLDVNGYWINSQDPVTGTVVPEPCTMLLLGSGLLGFAGLGRRKLKKTRK